MVTESGKQGRDCSLDHRRMAGMRHTADLAGGEADVAAAVWPRHPPGKRTIL